MSVWEMVDKETLENGGYAAIVNEAKSRNLLPVETDLTSGEKVVEAAHWLINMAYDARQQGAKGEDVETILRMAGVEGNGASLPPKESPKEKEEEASDQEATEAEPEPEKEPEPEPESEPEGNKEEEKPKRKYTRRKKNEDNENVTEFMGLPVPDEWEGDFPKLPKDVTEISDVELRRLYAQFGALLSRANWVLANHRSQKARAERMKDWTFAKALRDVQGSNAETRKAAASLDPEVEKWTEAIVEHETNVYKLSSLRDVFASNIERLSREMTMRSDERIKVHVGGSS